MIYSPSELVRLELLCYENPEGLHPVEEAWRNLARKLMEQVKETEADLTLCLDEIQYKNSLPERLREYKSIEFPKQFKPTRPTIS